MPAADAPARTLNDTLDKMAAALRALYRAEQTGPLAELRRLDVDRPVAPAFHALLADCAPDHLFASTGGLDAMTQSFARVAQMMALKPDDLSHKALGKVLHALDYPQTRLAMLLNARGATLDDLVRRAARRIALSDEPLPYRELGLLLLTIRSEQHDSLCLKIARDYQRAERAPAPPAA